MNNPITLADVKALEKELASSGKAYRITNEDQNTDTMVSFQFIDTHNGKTVIVDSMMFTLEMEYYSNMFEAAVEEVIEMRPEFENADFDAEEGEHIDLLDDVLDEFEDSDDFQICEFLDVDDSEENTLFLDVCLNLPAVTEADIAKFIKEYKAKTFEPDTTLYSFTNEGDEDED